jgi:FKBP-type peptidyl-prolyl cis-trans isomerase
MKTLITLTTIFLLCLSSPSFASKIFKWTDSEGNTHYGERPPSQQATQIKVRKGPSNVSSPAAKPGNQQKATNKLLDAFARERKDKEEAETKAAAEKQRRDKNCSSAKRRIAGLKLGGRQYEVTEQGERRYLNEADIRQRTAEAQKVADKWCQ